MTELVYSPLAFDDVDLFSDWEVGLGWDIESTQLSSGAVRVDFDHIELPELAVFHFRMKGTMHSAFAIPEGMVMFVICRTKLPLVWCGTQVPPTLLPICRSSFEQYAIMPPGWDSYEFMMTEELIRRHEIFPPKFFDKTTRLEDAYLPLAEPATAQFLSQLDRLFDGVRCTRPDSRVGRAEFVDFLISGLQRVVDAGLASRGMALRPTRRADLIPKAQHWIRAHLASDFTVDELAGALGVSYRLLNYAFQDVFGVSPYQYVLIQRLHGVRRKLKATDCSISDACFDFGFSTPSRFTRQYKRLFGELPSDTVKKKISIAVHPPAD